MKTRAAVAFAAKQPLEIVEVDLEGPRAGEVLVDLDLLDEGLERGEADAEHGFGCAVAGIGLAGLGGAGPFQCAHRLLKGHSRGGDGSFGRPFHCALGLWHEISSGESGIVAECR